MHLKWVFKHLYPWFDKRIYLLAFLWTVGLLLGILLCVFGPYDHIYLFCGVINSAPAPQNLFLLCILPIASIAATLVSPLFLITCFTMLISAISHGFCGMTIYMAVGNAGWLLRPLLMFTGSITSVLIWWLVFQGRTGRHMRRYIFFAIIVCCLGCILDLFIISPFWGDLAKLLLEGFA